MENEMMVRPEGNLKATDIRAQVNLIQEVMKAVMIENTHYGKVPGCGDKPTLLKPGAEKLMSTFRLAVDPQVIDLSINDERRFRVVAKISHQQSGIFLGSGVGEASTGEDKYKWRGAVNSQEFAEFPEDQKRKKWKKGYQGKPDYQIEQVRTCPSDLANTVLKMAKKRALVDGVLTVTAASDIFTQDIEDMPAEVLGKSPAETPKQQMPSRKSDTAVPQSDVVKTMTSRVAKHFLPKGASKFHSYLMEGFDNMYIQTSDPAVIDCMERHGKEKDLISVEYEESTWTKGDKSGTNRLILTISAQQEANDAQEPDNAPKDA